MSEEKAVEESLEEPKDEGQDDTQKQMLMVGIVAGAASAIAFWFMINIYFDRWAIKTGGFSPFLPYPTLPGPSFSYQHWLGFFALYLLIGVPFASVTIAEVIYMAVKFRDRPGAKSPEEGIVEDRIPRANRGNQKSLLYVNVLVAVILFSLTAYSLPLNGELLGTPPKESDPVTVFVTGHQWYWEFQYANNKTVNASDGTPAMLVPINTEIIFKVTSADVLHDFSIPSLAVSIYAYPGNVNTGWVEIYDKGNYTAFCVELCGVGHADMYADIEAVSPAEFAAWCGTDCTTS